MPFVLIKGSFHPEAGIPDGDSVRFKPDNLTLLKRLEGRPAEVGTGPETTGTVQLRLEGIDAIEKSAIQPLAKDSRDNLFKLIGLTSSNPTPRGFILSRMTDDKSRRPIAFAFAGAAPHADGADVHLAPPLLRKSVNFRQMREGFAYPLYYNTLFAELRRTFDEALKKAKQDKVALGIWKRDATLSGVRVRKKADLATVAPVWPKLWRRLQEFLGKNAQFSGSAFIAFLAAKNERLDVLDVMEERGLQDVVAIKNGKVKLLEPPENLRVRGKAGKRK